MTPDNPGFKRSSTIHLADHAGLAGREIEAALPHLSQKSSVIFDDTVSQAREWRGKGSKAVPRIIESRLEDCVFRHWGADLVATGRRAESGLLGRLEMTAYSIIRQSPCQVVSV